MWICSDCVPDSILLLLYEACCSTGNQRPYYLLCLCFRFTDCSIYKAFVLGFLLVVVGVFLCLLFFTVNISRQKFAFIISLASGKETSLILLMSLCVVWARLSSFWQGWPRVFLCTSHLPGACIGNYSLVMRIQQCQLFKDQKRQPWKHKHD